MHFMQASKKPLFKNKQIHYTFEVILTRTYVWHFSPLAELTEHKKYTDTQICCVQLLRCHPSPPKQIQAPLTVSGLRPIQFTSGTI